MITDEIGVEKMLKEIFNISDNDDLVVSNYFETVNLEHIKFQSTAYEKIINYLKNESNFSLDILLAINTTLAYGHSTKELDIEIGKYINKNINIIIKKLDSIKNLGNYLNKEVAQSYESIFTSKISYNLINNITSLCLYHSRLYKSIHFYGVQNLLLSLSKYSHIKYSKWFLKTKRNDLKIIYAEAMLNTMNSVDSLSEKDTYSEIIFVRVLAKVIFYNIDRNLKYSNIKKYFFDLELNKENLYFILFYFASNILDLKNENSIKNLNINLKKASKYLEYLDINILEEFLNHMNVSIIFGLIDEIEDSKLKSDSLQVLFTNLKFKIENEKFISNFSIEKANILGNILLVLDEKFLNALLINFDNMINKMEEPYYIYKFHDSWNEQISILLHSLIIIYIYNKEKNDITYFEYKKKFLKVKKGFAHTNDNYINDILEQIN